jgi:hypothetical protein
MRRLTLVAPDANFIVWPPASDLSTQRTHISVTFEPARAETGNTQRAVQKPYGEDGICRPAWSGRFRNAMFDE